METIGWIVPKEVRGRPEIKRMHERVHGKGKRVPWQSQLLIQRCVREAQVFTTATGRLSVKEGKGGREVYGVVDEGTGSKECLNGTYTDR